MEIATDVSTSKKGMTCAPLRLKKKLLLVRNKVVMAKKFELLIPGLPKAEIERI